MGSLPNIAGLPNVDGRPDIIGQSGTTGVPSERHPDHP
jgi:hypothetical protein